MSPRTGTSATALRKETSEIKKITMLGGRLFVLFSRLARDFNGGIKSWEQNRWLSSKVFAFLSYRNVLTSYLNQSSIVRRDDFIVSEEVWEDGALIAFNINGTMPPDRQRFSEIVEIAQATT